jgi:hypothetical protein
MEMTPVAGRYPAQLNAPLVSPHGPRFRRAMNLNWPETRQLDPESYARSPSGRAGALLQKTEAPHASGRRAAARPWTGVTGPNVAGDSEAGPPRKAS